LLMFSEAFVRGTLTVQSTTPFWVAGSFTIAFLSTLGSAQAQIIPDNTLPVNSTVSTGNCATCTVIDGGTVRGANLFHSFREFSIPTGGEAYFNNDAQVQSILSRVTGTNLSNIDGLIRANGIANLFLLNPNGIVFGPNASLEIGGSFVATTATSLKLPDGSEYSATSPQAPPILAVNLTPGVQFGSRAAGSTVSNTGNLTVPAGQSITLLGGTTTSTGTLTAPGGMVQVLGDRVALQDNARVNVSSPTAGGTVLIGGDDKGQGTVPNSQFTDVGQNVVIKADALTSGNGGKVIVWSDGDTRFNGTITAQGGVQGGNGGFVETSGKNNLTVGNTATVSTLAPLGQTGTWLLDPAILTIEDGANQGTINNGINDPTIATITNRTIVTALSNTNVTLQATDTITATNVSITGGTANDPLPVNSDSNLTLEAPTINLNNAVIWQSGSGEIRLQASNISLSNSARIFQTGGGNITLDTTTAPGTSVSINGIDPTSTVPYPGGVSRIQTTPERPATTPQALGGKITIITGSFQLTNGGRINSFTEGDGQAGNVEVIAGDSVRIEGSSSSNGNVINSGIVSSLTGTGRAGDISIKANAVSISGGARINSASSGTGDAGSVTVNASGNVTIKDSGTQIFSNLEGTGNGNAGNVTITADSVSVSDGAQILSRTSGDGDAGDITITAFKTVEVSQPGNLNFGEPTIASDVISNAVGNGGNISIQAPSITFSDRVTIAASILQGTGTIQIPGVNGGFAEAGDISIVARDKVLLQGRSRLFSEVRATGARGIGGNVTVIAPDVEIKDSSALITRVGAFGGTSPIGQAGNITIRTNGGRVLIEGPGTGESGIRSELQPGVLGNLPAGSILIETGLLDLRPGAQIIASTASPGDAGEIDIHTHSLTMSDATISTEAQAGSTGFAGTIAVNARDSILLQNQSEISSTGNQGQIVIGGQVNPDFSITPNPAGSITLDNSKIRTDSNDPTNNPNIFAGTIAINTRNTVLLRNGSEISSTGNQGTIVMGGGVNFGNNGNSSFSISPTPVNSITLDNSKISTNSDDPTNNLNISAGTIAINARDDVLLQNSTVSSTGNQGSIVIGGEVNEVQDDFIITPVPVRAITLLKGSSISTTNNNQSGIAGDVSINATDTIILDDKSQITANTFSTGNAGNITIDPDILLLRRGSLISTSAGNGTASDGGNISIDGTFIVAAPGENSDIFANAFGGRGGVITINATNLYWIDFLSRDELARLDPVDLNPQNIPTNDITAISQTNPTLNGTVTLNTLNLDVTQGLGELNLVPIDTSKLITQGCATGKRFALNENRFSVTGRSGIPANPEDVFRSSRILTELGAPSVTEDVASTPTPPAPTTPSRTLIEAQGWIIAPNGKPRLVAQANNLTPSPIQQPAITCPNDSNSPSPP
jgi:filamentous hemagglutinin family protein